MARDGVLVQWTCDVCRAKASAVDGKRPDGWLRQEIDVGGGQDWHAEVCGRCDEALDAIQAACAASIRAAVRELAAAVAALHGGRNVGYVVGTAARAIGECAVVDAVEELLKDKPEGDAAAMEWLGRKA